MASQSENLSASIRRYVVIGIASVGILVVGLGGWAAVANISGAVVAPGQVQVKGNSKRIQHREGGIIGKIAVKDGDRVSAGDLLIQLDDTLVRTNLAVIEKQLVEFTARETRLIAERDDLSDVSFPEWLAELGANDSADGRNALNAMRGEERLFVTRREMLTGQVAQLKERIQQFELQSEGLVSQRDAKDEEIKIIDAELESLQDLLDRGLVSKPRVLELQRNTTRLRGEHGALISEIAVAKGRISETRLTIIQTAQDRQEQVLSQLREVQAEIVRLTEQRIAARDQLRRIDIRAPQNGIIHELAFHTIGGVIQPGETILNIVPDGFDLIVEARVTPTDRDQTAAGQAAVITFSAFSQRTTPQMHGTVETISADLTVDEATGANYFSAQIVLNEGEKERLGDLELVPGMPAETFIQTQERTVLSFLLKPLTDNLRRAFREE
ncbi:MAG: HlyD family type I secretion periplasmic adaptor subunit [Pseudomonadota bacterium]